MNSLFTVNTLHWSKSLSELIRLVWPPGLLPTVFYACSITLKKSLYYFAYTRIRQITRPFPCRNYAPGVPVQLIHFTLSSSNLRHGWARVTWSDHSACTITEKAKEARIIRHMSVLAAPMRRCDQGGGGLSHHCDSTQKQPSLKRPFSADSRQ